PPAQAEPAIRHPIDDTRARAGPAGWGAEQGRVPALSESDAIVREALSRVPGATGFERFFYPQEIVRRSGATMENLPRQSCAAWGARTPPASRSNCASCGAC